VSIESTLARVSAIRQAVADPSALLSARSSLTGGVEAPAEGGGGSGSSFAVALNQASSTTPTAASSATVALPAAPGQSGISSYAPLPGSGSAAYGLQSVQGLQGVAGSSAPGSSGSVGSRIVAVAESQIGQSEQPPGSNESPAIAQYRTATAGAMPGEPWCAYFASWAANQAGEPLGAQGQGLGSVSEIWSWAQSSGRAVTNGPGVVPKPGDLIVFGGEHVGIVRGVLPNGQIATIEGNYESKVSANVRSPGEATGYVSMS
jgi:hypothetical protein